MRAPARCGGGSFLPARGAAPSRECDLLLPHLLLARRGWQKPKLPGARSRRNGKEQLFEELRERSRISATPSGASNCQASALSAGKSTAVPGEPGIEREAA